MRPDDSCPEDARAFARWSALGAECPSGHDSEFTPDGECVECLKLGADDASEADHARDEARERAQDAGTYRDATGAWDGE